MQIICELQYISNVSFSLTLVALSIKKYAFYSYTCVITEELSSEDQTSFRCIFFFFWWLRGTRQTHPRSRSSHLHHPLSPSFNPYPLERNWIRQKKIKLRQRLESRQSRDGTRRCCDEDSFVVETEALAANDTHDTPMQPPRG